MTVVAFVNAHGIAEFNCVDCGGRTVSFGPREKEPVCMACRLFREYPEIPETARALLRGEGR